MPRPGGGLALNHGWIQKHLHRLRMRLLVHRDHREELSILILLTLSVLPSVLMGQAVSSREMRTKQQWIEKWLTSPRAKPLPFSFEYNGKPGGDLLKEWPGNAKTRQLDAVRMEHSLAWTDPQTGLEVRCVAVEYLDFPVVEWTLYFRNTSGKDTPILADVQALDLTIPPQKPEKAYLHYIDGDGMASAYTPRLKSLDPGTELKFSPDGGRPTSGSFPYYDLDWNGKGRLVVVGWSGQWASSFVSDKSGNLHIKAGQQLTHLKLHPGEEIRSPLIVQLFWQGGDWIQAQNLWRRWMTIHNMPKPAGNDVSPILAGSTVETGLPNYSIELDNEKDQEYFIKRYADEKLKLNYWWMDIFIGSHNFWVNDAAYQCCGSVYKAGFYTVRDWQADRKLFPNGLRAVSEFANAEGMKTIVWYEPEHVWPGSQLAEDHPDWLLSVSPGAYSRQAINQGIPVGDRKLLNLGNPNAVTWLVDNFSRNVEAEKIDVYRQDFNIEPLNFWRNADPADRQGMTENLYVQGYLAFWDGLLKRDPNLLIDTCASGGRRNDVETLRRSVPLWRSDYTGKAVVEQTHTYGLAFWIPYFGTGTRHTDTYNSRSVLGSSLLVGWDMRDKNLDYDALRKFTAEFWQVAPDFVGDYYPLTEFSAEASSWLGWQFNRPEEGDGVVQAFRRDKNDDAAKDLHLRGLDPAARYQLTDLSVGVSKTTTGRDLMQQGLHVEIPQKPGAAVITYKKAR